MIRLIESMSYRPRHANVITLPDILHFLAVFFITLFLLTGCGVLFCVR